MSRGEPRRHGLELATEPVEHPLAGLFVPGVRQVFRWGSEQGRELLLIDHPRCRAIFARQGGQLLHFQPRGERPLLWCAARWPRLGAIRGGVPVCWPWFGRHPQESGWPHHGWARLTDWRLQERESSDAGVRLRWRLALHDWEVELQAELGDELAMTLTTRHADQEPCLLSQALHAYWRISDIARVAVLGLEGASGQDLLNRQRFTQQGELRPMEGCHRVFDHTGPLHLQDAGWQRRLRIDTGGSPNTVVWHPGGRPLADVGWKEGLGFASIEAAACGTGSQVLAPGEEARIQLRARVE
ncbi:D-hexose-6-phosphate mutarotase [Pseudomonas tohonis]|uniref:D-hexose-6-phosphate mutarotase n=1 Tax=Pseudomonas tohonis TaxID=2725477 RepID=UPI001F3EE597|nr:D-hexose-6-phosphate mutarotase [Pseudomonas tohonis]